MGCVANTVRSLLGALEAPKYGRKVKRYTKLEPYEEYLRASQEAASPDLATVLLPEIAARCYTGGLTC